MLLPILGTLSLLGAVYFLMPLAIGVCHIGMFWPAALLLLAAAWCFFPGFFRRLPKWLKAVLLSGVGPLWVLPPPTVPPAMTRRKRWCCWGVRCTTVAPV